MQMYKGLPIITNKITEAERQNIPHHIFDQIALEEQPWTVSNFRIEAQKTIREIRSRGRLPILVGGTHYYAKAVLFNDYFLDQKDGASDVEEGDSRPEFPILDAPTSTILAELREVDPKMASIWHPSDRRKIQRSLEIWLQTGKTASQTYEEQSQQRLERQRNEAASPDGRRTAYSSLVFWLKTENNVLKQRLDSRVDTMLASGLIEEAQAISAHERHLTAAGITLDKTKGIWASIGYKEMEPYISALLSSSNNNPDLPTLKTTSITSTKSATRRYARTQDRWIRIHFSRALLEANAFDTLYPLDSTNPDQWCTDVLQPATEITSRFLRGGDTPLPAPESLSDMARATLAGIRTELGESDNHGSSTVLSGRRCRYCEVCDKTMMTEKEWIRHLKGNGHKKAVAGRKKWEAFQAWKVGREEEKGEGEDGETRDNEA